MAALVSRARLGSPGRCRATGGGGETRRGPRIPGLGVHACGRAGRPAGPVSAPREQALLKARVVDRDTEAWQRDPAFSGLHRVGGVDVSFVKGDSVRACASLVVLSYPELEVTLGGGLRDSGQGQPRSAPWTPGQGSRAFVGFHY